MTSVAIIGSGPSGFYIAEALAKKLPDAAIDIIDRLPTPFGLVRAGVAPDHQGTKNIVRQFERTLSRNGVRFLGNVEVGTTVAYQELKDLYPVVIVAIGALMDRRLGIPGEDLPEVYGSGAFVGWYNGHPDYRDLDPQLSGGAVAVIGNGNVSLDIARILAKTPAELAHSDICRHALQVIAAAPLSDIYLLGRRGPLQASFTPPELSELGELSRCVPLVDPAQIPDTVGDMDPKDVKTKEKNLAILRGFIGRAPDERPLRLHLLFNMAPVEVLGQGHVQGMRVVKTRVENGRAVPTGEHIELPVSAVVTAIGYRCAPFAGLPFDAQRGIVVNRDGRVEPGVYTAGWCKRGPQGVIPANRADSLAVAERILADLARARAGERPGPAGLDVLLRARGARPVSFDEWKRINDTEMARAEEGKPREKFTRTAEMLSLL